MVLDCIQKAFCCLNRFFQKCVFFVLDFDYLLELKLMLEIFDFSDQIEVIFKCSQVEEHKRVVDLNEWAEFPYS